MNSNNALERALALARDIERQVTAAASEAADQMKPHLEQSLRMARELQDTAKGADVARHLRDFIAMGSDAMRESAELTRQTAATMVEQSKKIVDAASAARPKKPE